jgi:phosphoribosyl 1,2-cyclic phosphodiesterase
MIVIPLQSGSTGNCIYVKTQDHAFLFDAGISAKCAGERLASLGKNITDVDALFITHEHSDHIQCAAIFAKKFHLPIYLTHKTYARAKKRFRLDGLPELVFFSAGDVLNFGTSVIQSIPTPHDAVDGCVYTVQDQKHKVGIFTDLGHVFSELENVLPTLDGLYIESNYDPTMLRTGKYPESLKRRISGPGGHISNKDAANLIADHASERLQWVCIGHLSEENNSPEKALATHRHRLGCFLPIGVASRYTYGPICQTAERFDSTTAITAVAVQTKKQTAAASIQLSLF